MAKLEYEKSLVDQTLDILASAKEPLEDIESDMSSALGMQQPRRFCSTDIPAPRRS